MLSKTIQLWIAVWFAGFAFAQAPAADGVDRVFYFSQPASPQQGQEMVNTLRSIAEIQRISLDAATGSIAAHGTADQITLAQSLVQALDLPVEARPPSPARYTYPAPAPPGHPQLAFPAVRVFYLTNTNTPLRVQELVNTIRSLSEIQRVVAYNKLWAIILRGTDDQVAMSEWLVKQLDRPAGQAAPQGQNPAAFTFQPDTPRDTAVATRIFYLTNTRQPQDTQEIINAVRSMTEIQRVAAFNQASAIALRGTTDQAALAEWLITRLDKPSGAQPAPKPPAPPLEYPMPSLGNTVQVFYLENLASAQDIQSLVAAIRTMTQMQRVVAYNSPRAITLRGTDGQVAQAAALVQQRDKPAAQ